MRFASKWCLCLALLAALPALAAANPHEPEFGWRHRERRRESFGPAQGYVAVKGGGLALGAAGATGGTYVGVETGITASEVLDVGFSVDYFHRRSRDLDVWFETDHGFDPPVRGEITRFESSADFVPIGVTARLRLPTGTQACRPFVAATLAYEVLHLSFFDRNAPVRPYDNILTNDETFMGFGWQASAGVDFGLAPGVGVFGELGLHRGTPSQAVEVNGDPVDLRVQMNGAFLRGGVRVAL